MKPISDRWLDHVRRYAQSSREEKLAKQIQRDRAAIREHRDTIIKSGKEGLDTKLYRATLPEESK